jgi:hypothetical protein
MPDELPISSGLSNSISSQELLRKLTGMAADVVRGCSVELALGWLWCNKTGEPLPRVPPHLLDVLTFVRDHGLQEVDASYRGRDYFEDCLRLALRKSQTVGLLKTRSHIRAGRRARARPGHTAAHGT